MKITLHYKPIVAVFFLLLSISVFSQNKSSAGGPPTRGELIGFWKKVPFPRESKLNKVNPWPEKFQWFAFYENGKVYSLMMDEDDDFTAEQLKHLFTVLPADKTPDFVYNGTFLTIDNKDDKDYREVWGLNLFDKDLNTSLKRGRLIMTLDDGKGNVVYYRLLERVN